MAADATGSPDADIITIGLMSGTSTDGVDGVLARFDAPGRPQLLAGHTQAMPASLREEMLALNQPGHNELERAALAANQLADVYADTVNALLDQAGLTADAVDAIGAHGQTVRHRPERGYSLQLNAPARLAEKTGIAVIADFRARDIAAGGQGAPLVPAFHQAMFAGAEPRAILNLGGIANLTLLHPGRPVTGFDCGPANMLMDAWIRRCRALDFDAGGAWAAGGHCDTTLLERLLDDEPWLAAAPPKSTGRDLFNLDWLASRLASRMTQDATPPADADIQATLLAFTVTTITRALERHAPDTRRVLACGGGTANPVLMRALGDALPCPLETTEAHGLHPQWVEAAAFAWLARAWLREQPASLPEVTGARAAHRLGCYWPAG